MRRWWETTSCCHALASAARQRRTSLATASVDAQGDRVAGVAGGVGLHVVGFLVDHDGGSSVGEEGVRGTGIRQEIFDFEGARPRSTAVDGDVLGQVAGVVAQRVLGAVLFGL